REPRPAIPAQAVQPRRAPHPAGGRGPGGVTRVVHVASGREWRGGQRQVWLLARELARSGDVEQIVVTGAGSELGARLVREGIRVRPVPWSAGLEPRGLPGPLAEARAPRPLRRAPQPHAPPLP